MNRWSLLAIVPLLQAAASDPPPESEAVGARVAQIRSFARDHGDRIWPGFGSDPFSFLLIDADSETLLCREQMPQGFTAAGVDPATGCRRFTRPRSKLPAGLLAAMPLFGLPSTIVMGTPAATGRTPTAWSRTILHEHFHQWQASLPGYYARTDALDLKGGDETGMWMLNFSFPYDEPQAGSDYATASRALAAALDARHKPGFLRAFDRYLAARRALETRVGARNWRYMEFQLWQEGIARWTELELGRSYPDAALRAETVDLTAATLRQLRNPDLRQQKRELAYAYGAGEAWLLQSCRYNWRKAYPDVLALGPLLKAVRANCAGRRARRV